MPLIIDADVRPGWYQHYKGNLYYVLLLGRHTETEEWMVAYVGTEGHPWIRPLTSWSAPLPDNADGSLNIAPRFQRMVHMDNVPPPTIA